MPDFFVPMAAAETFNRQVDEARNFGDLSSQEILIASTVGLVLAAVLFISAFVYFRRKRRREDQEHNRSSMNAPARLSSSKSESEDDEDSDSGRRRRRKRRRRRDHRPRNPTLDKTGGLPPLRPDDELPKF